MSKIKFVFFMVIMGFIGTTANASQFCLGGFGMGEQCLYDDAVLCIRDADPPSTYCTVNPDAVLSYSGNSRYCVVSSFNTAECFFADRGQCGSVATSRQGICVDRVIMKDKNNPYRFDTRIQN